MMRRLWPRWETPEEEGLYTVFEMPMPPEQILYSSSLSTNPKNLNSILSGGKASDSGDEIQLLLGVIAAPLVSHPIFSPRSATKIINVYPFVSTRPVFLRLSKKQVLIYLVKDVFLQEMSMAQYIVQQYIAAAGGDDALNSIASIYAMGKVKMAAAEYTFCGGEDAAGSEKRLRKKRVKNDGEIGGFVLWEKRPNLWSLEMLVSGCKIAAGSDGKVVWRQTPWHRSHASRGPPRPLRRTLQGLNPMSTAALFSKSTCSGETSANGEDCFVLKTETEAAVLNARSTRKLEIVNHTVRGYFSQRTGLLVRLRDTQIMKIRSPGNNDVTWETSMTSTIADYRPLNGVNVAYGGRTVVSLCRIGGNSRGRRAVTAMEEVWSIEEVDVNVKGLSVDFFLPPADLNNREE
ncbi:unnamed protein product [Cuscuta campestris]|uniref:Uncharacterized protein n=1 Tax=Cuscuta campestris TaxID=132261 RepID=A0A484NDZ1_9ASTE|nr:unnamed protein product [Cuscuta campestris]